MTDREYALYTCSWTAYKPDMGTPVRTSLGTPRQGFRWPYEQVWEVTPRKNYLRLAPALFEEYYIAQLEHYGVRLLRGVFTRLAAKSVDPRLVLLCFEKNPAECHRRQFADWWNGQTGEDVPEASGFRGLQQTTMFDDL